MSERSSTAGGVALISDGEALAALCRRLRGGAYLALDTEFVREKTYRPQLCLVQIAGGTEDAAGANGRVGAPSVACIDPLAEGLATAGLAPLRELLFDPGVVKVLHAGQQDLEIFALLWEDVPSPLFDTQLAATLLGYGDQISYAALVAEVLGVRLDKSQTRTDWSARPLSDEQLRYAADDVRHLHALYPRLRRGLAAKHRLDWLDQDFAALADPARYRAQPERAWQRVRQSGRLRGVKLLALQRLAAWREREAQKLDRPRRWLLADDALLTLAQQLPTSPAQLERLRGIPPRSLARYGDGWLALLTEVKQTPRERWPADPPAPERLTTEQEALADALSALLKLRAAEQQISPGALATRRELDALVRGDAETGGLLSGWRHRLVGRDLQALLAGERSLRVEAGRLVTRAG